MVEFQSGNTDRTRSVLQQGILYFFKNILSERSLQKTQYFFRTFFENVLIQSEGVFAYVIYLFMYTVTYSLIFSFIFCFDSALL